MANNKIQIKRSTANATVTGLAPGELAFTQAGNTLHIGLPDGSGVIRVGGRMVPGSLTPNQALVANSSSAIDKVIVANLVPTKIFANGVFGGAGEVLASGPDGSVYWVDPGTITSQPAGSNTMVQYNASNVLAASAGFTFDYATNNLFVGNTLVLGTAPNQGTIDWDFYTGTANNANNLGGFAPSAYFKVTDSATLSGNLTFTGAQLQYNSADINFAGQRMDISANLNVTGALINAISSNIKVNDAEIAGNLVVSGQVTTINTVSITIRDNLVEFASNNETTDVVDSGWFSPAGGGGNKWYSGVARIAGKSTPTEPWFHMFGTTVNPNTNPTVDPGAKNATLQAWLRPYGAAGAFVVDENEVSIKANSSVAVAITANTITVTTLNLTAPLPVTSGGTGRNSISPDAILIGNNSTGFDELLLGAAGLVLQSNGTALLYDTLDGGTF